MTTLGIDASRALRARRTGTERYAYELVVRLSALAHRADWRVRLYTDQPPPSALRTAVPHAEWVVMPRPRLWTHTALAPELRRRPPDLFFEPAHVLPLWHPPASVVTVHDVGYEYFPDAHTRFQRFYLRLTTRWHVRAARLILADSHATRNDLVRLYAAPPARVRVVYPGVDLAHFAPRSPDAVAAVRARYGIHGRYLLYVGTLQPRKNLRRVLDAFAQTAPAFPDVQLVLVGAAGWRMDAFADLLTALGDRVVRTGYVDDAELPALYTGAVALVFPSLFEGFGFPVLEAHACGTPVIASTTTSLPEVAGDAALLVNPLETNAIADAMRRLLEDDALRADLAARGRANAARFTWDASAAHVWDALMEAYRG